MLTAIFAPKRQRFQSPYGGIGASDTTITFSVAMIYSQFQSPCGGIGASDCKHDGTPNDGIESFHHLAVA